MHEAGRPVTRSLEEIKSMAASVAREMQAGAMTDELRARFIELRAALFQRGIHDPVLARFDSATVPRASQQEIAAQLAAVAESL
ncbi:MAG TPA: hypothetical protein VNL91_08645 [Thermoanaerobaculia bacterium]|nr:hypothetical protein [Thermoanaerobaculia bacterium]